MTEFKRYDNPSTQPPTPGIGGDESTRATLNELSKTAAELVRIVSVRKWLLFIPFCIATTGAFVMSLYVPRQYVASTLFERRDDPVLVNLPRNDGAGAFRAFRQSLVQDITSQKEILEMVQKLNLADRYPLTQAEKQKAGEKAESKEWRTRKIAGKITAGLQVIFHQQSVLLDTIEITFTADRPEMMSEILDGVRDHYIEMTQRRITKLLERTKDYFESEVAKRRITMDALEDDLIKFKTEHRGLDPLNPTASIVQLASLRNQQLNLQRRRREIETQLQERRRFLKDGGGAGEIVLPGTLTDSIRIDRPAMNPEARQLVTEIGQLSRQIAELKITRGMTDRHPDVVALFTKQQLRKRELAQHQQVGVHSVSVNGIAVDLNDQIASIATDPGTPPKSQAEVEVRILERMIADHDEEMERVEGEVAAFEAMQLAALSHNKEFRSRQAQVDRAQQELSLHQGYADLVGRVLAAESSERGIKFEKVKPAMGSSLPTSPRMPTVFLLALIAGGVTGIVMVLLAELFDRTIRTRDQVLRGLNLPVLESIDEIITSAVRRKRFIVRRILAPSAAMACLIVVCATAGIAYLSLNNRDLYERALQVPRQKLSSVLHAWNNQATVSQIDLSSMEAGR